MLYLVLYALLGLIIINRVEAEGRFDDYVEERDLSCVSVNCRRQTSEIFYGVLVWIWPIVVLKSIVQMFL
jgi:hypothetical protein